MRVVKDRDPEWWGLRTETQIKKLNSAKNFGCERGVENGEVFEDRRGIKVFSSLFSKEGRI